VFRSVISRGLALAASGAVLGVLAALSLRGALRTLGTGAEVDEPIVVLTVVALVLTAAGAATAWPALRAAAVDPVEALRRD
jgi:ABC-type lipoprotein release transport system permease subunit